MIATLFTAVTIVDTPTIRFMAKRQLRWPRCEDRGITASGTNNHQLLGKKEITMDDSKTENNKAIVLEAFDTLPSQSIEVRMRSAAFSSSSETSIPAL
jgi:hypothetical protein